MNDELSMEQADSLADAMFQNVQIVLAFVEKRKDAIQAVANFPRNETPHRDACMYGLWGRSYFWLQTSAKLNSVKDFQAAAVGNRALLEIFTDMTLIYGDTTNAAGWKMHWHGMSSKLKHAENVTRYFNEKNLDIPEELLESQNFVIREKAIVESMRNAIWNTRKHRERWTGKESLFDDLPDADKILGSLAKDILDVPLTEYYRTKFGKMNWYVHSGTNAFWELRKEAFPLIYGFHLKGCADFSLLCTRIILRDFKLDEHLPNFNDEWQKVNFDRFIPILQNVDDKILY